jgi:hypothetical protein
LHEAQSDEKPFDKTHVNRLFVNYGDSAKGLAAILITINQQTRNTHDSALQEVPGPSEQNNQPAYDELGRGVRDGIFASKHKGDPQWRDRRVQQNVFFIVSTGSSNDCCSHFPGHPGMVRFVAKLMVGDMYRLYSFVPCGGIRFGSELSLKSWRALKASYVEPVGVSAETQVVGSGHEITQVRQLRQKE